jgi:hypothetical protein
MLSNFCRVPQMLNEQVGTSASVALLKRNDLLKPSVFPETLKSVKEIEAELKEMDRTKIRVAKEILDEVEAKSALDAEYLRGLSSAPIDGLFDLEKKYMDRLEIIRLLIIHKSIVFRLLVMPISFILCRH